MDSEKEYSKVTCGFDWFVCFCHNNLTYVESPNQFKDGCKILMFGAKG